MASGERGALLIVDGDPDRRAQLARALSDFPTLEAEGARSATELLATRPIALLLSRYRLADGDGLELLRHSRASSPSTRRLLMTEYESLPEIVRAGAGAVAERVIQGATRVENVRRIVGELLSPEAAAPRPAFDWPAMEALLKWTAGRIVEVPGVVIRRHSPSAPDLQLQFVLPAEHLEALRHDVVARWRFPIKPKDGKTPSEQRRHPVLKMLGDLSGDHEVYTRRLEGDPDEIHVYLALLPWRREQRVTAALGIWRHGFREILRQLLVDVHRHAVEEVAELPLPVLPSQSESTGPGQTVLEYDWVVTDSYIGPDRRDSATSFFNRYVLIGRRRRVSSRLARTTPSFVDRFARPVLWYALAYLVLSSVDTAFTYWYVRAGAVHELNPLLRPLVLHHPWGFVAVKYLVSLSAFILVARFQLFRLGRYLLGGTVLAYLLLDAYWIALLSLR
jgi:CheY-like chemotaxis protein